MKQKKLSTRLIEAEEKYELGSEAMAFVLGKNYQIYRLYRKGKFDYTYSAKKGALISSLDNIDLEIRNKILLLERALRKHGAITQIYTQNGKPHGKKLKTKVV